MILVTGATGNVGRHALEMLLGQGREVRAASRAPERATWPAGVRTVAADLADPASLATALAGVEAVFLFAVPGSGPAFVAAAEGLSAYAGWCCCPPARWTTRPRSRTGRSPPTTPRSSRRCGAPIWNGPSCDPTCSPPTR